MTEDAVKPTMTAGVMARIAENRAKALKLLEANKAQEMVQVQYIPDEKITNVQQAAKVPHLNVQLRLEKKATHVKPTSKGKMSSSTSSPNRKRKLSDEGIATKETKPNLVRIRAKTSSRPCKSIQAAFPHSFTFGTRDLELYVEYDDNSNGYNEGSDTTLIFSILERGIKLAGSAVVSTKDVSAPRLVSFTFDVVGAAPVSEVALRSIFLFLKLQFPAALYVENTVWMKSERSCSKFQFAQFLKGLQLFQDIEGDTEWLPDVKTIRRIIASFLSAFPGHIVDVCP
jgi:hypothetical protein